MDLTLESMKDEISLSLEHAKAFTDGMLPLLRIRITQKTQTDEVYHLNLPIEVIHAVPELRSQNIKITFNRDLASRYKGIEMFDLLHPLMKYMLEVAKSDEINGKSAFIKYKSRGFDDCNVKMAKRSRQKDARRI